MNLFLPSQDCCTLSTWSSLSHIGLVLYDLHPYSHLLQTLFIYFLKIISQFYVSSSVISISLSVCNCTGSLLLTRTIKWYIWFLLTTIFSCYFQPEIIYSMPETTYLQAIVNTQVINGFTVKVVKSQRESAAYLTIMTRYLQNKYQVSIFRCL